MLLAILLVLLGDSSKLGGKNPSQYTTNDKFAVLTGNMTLEANSQSEFEAGNQKQTQLLINFPSGFNKDNCVCIAFGMKTDSAKNYSYGISSSISNQAALGSYPRHAVLGGSTDNTKIALQVWQSATCSKKVYYKLVLMKIS